MLNNLKFGRDDAESEQEFLQKVFLPTALFNRIKSDDKWLVLGRKGSGKTALCLTLFRELQQEKAYVSLIEPANFSIETHSTLSKGSISFSEASKLSWKYVFLVELGKYIIEAVSRKEGKNHRKWSDDAKKVRDFLVRGDDRFASGLEKALKITSEFTKFALEIASIKAEAERTPKIREASTLRDSLDDISQYIKICMAKYVEQPIYILIDKVDEYWSKNTESIDLVVGLLKAVKECREQIPQSQLIVFLRSDIFDTLRFDDLDKYRSISERIIWDESALHKLISLRICAAAGGKIDPDNAWEMFFPKNINGEKSFTHLLRFTLMRPRDLIQLCNHCKSFAENRYLDKIDKEAISNALPEYSRWKLDDLVIEYKVQYPFLEKLFWNVFYRAPHRFDVKKLKKRLAPRLKQWSSESGGEFLDPLEKLLDVLYRIGFIGVVKPGKTLYFYNGVPIIISDIKEFVVHPAFRPALEISESIEHIKSVKIIKNRPKDDTKLGFSKNKSNKKADSSEPKPESPPPPASPG